MPRRLSRRRATRRKHDRGLLYTLAWPHHPPGKNSRAARHHTAARPWGDAARHGPATPTFPRLVGAGCLRCPLHRGAGGAETGLPAARAAAGRRRAGEAQAAPQQGQRPPACAVRHYQAARRPQRRLLRRRRPLLRRRPARLSPLPPGAAAGLPARRSGWGGVRGRARCWHEAASPAGRGMWAPGMWAQAAARSGRGSEPSCPGPRHACAGSCQPGAGRQVSLTGQGRRRAARKGPAAEVAGAERRLRPAGCLRRRHKGCAWSRGRDVEAAAGRAGGVLRGRERSGWRAELRGAWGAAAGLQRGSPGTD